MDVINVVSSCVFFDLESFIFIVKIELIIFEFLDIFFVVFWIRYEIMKCKGIGINLFNIEDL